MRKKPQESKYERWSRLDKRIERERARHELTHLGMGTFYLVMVMMKFYTYVIIIHILTSRTHVQD